MSEVCPNYLPQRQPMPRYIYAKAGNFGSDYSSPQERAMLTGYDGKIRGENVSETFKGEFDVLQIWLK